MLKLIKQINIKESNKLSVRSGQLSGVVSNKPTCCGLMAFSFCCSWSGRLPSGWVYTILSDCVTRFDTPPPGAALTAFCGDMCGGADRQSVPAIETSDSIQAGSRTGMSPPSQSTLRCFTPVTSQPQPCVSLLLVSYGSPTGLPALSITAN